MSINAMCKWDDLVSYLEEINQTELLEYIDRDGDGYRTSQLFHYRKIERQPSIKMQVAAILVVLGEFQEAESVHSLRWENLGPAYDKVTNGILRRFMLIWPAV